MDVCGKLIDILVFCVVGFLLPALLVMFLADNVKDTYSDIRVRSFAENVSTKGYIDYQMYESFVSELNAAGVLVSPRIQVEHELLAPEYVMRSIDDAEGYLDGLFGGSNILHQDTLNFARPTVYDPGAPPAGSLAGNVAGTNTSTSGPSSGHVHGEECYLGAQHWHDENCPSREVGCDGGCTKHTHSGSSSSGTGCYRGAYHSGGGYTCGFVGTDRGEHYPGTCPDCGGSVTYIYCYGTCSGCQVDMFSTVRMHCFSCGYTINSSGSSHYVSYPGYYDCNCGKIQGNYYDSSGNLCTVCGGDGKMNTLACTKTDGGYYLGDGTQCNPLCDKVVTGLVAVTKEQVLTAGASLDTRVKATFSDGHTEIVTATVNGYDSALYNVVQTVTLSYGSYKGSVNTIGATSITIKVMVRYPTKTCSNGHVYYLVNGNSTPCPYCKAYPKTITVLGTASIPFCITKGTSLADNGICLKVVYYDGHSETIGAGWSDNLDENYVGEQTVTIVYKGASTTLRVRNERIKVSCSVCGHEYSLYPDNTDPGCPKCLSAIPVFTGKTLRYEETVSHGEILDELYHGSGIYYFSRGDRFEMELWKSDKTQKNTVFGRLFKTAVDEELVCMYGVKIRDEEVEK